MLMRTEIRHDCAESVPHTTLSESKATEYDNNLGRSVLTRFISGYLMTLRDFIVNDTVACTPVSSQLFFYFLGVG